MCDRDRRTSVSLSTMLRQQVDNGPALRCFPKPQSTHRPTDTAPCRWCGIIIIIIILTGWRLESDGCIRHARPAAGQRSVVYVSVPVERRAGACIWRKSAVTMTWTSDTAAGGARRLSRQSGSRVRLSYRLPAASGASLHTCRRISAATRL